MLTLIRTIIAMVIAASLQMGMTDATEVSPQQAVTECMDGIVALQEETTDRYAANKYVNFLVNLEGDEDTVKRMQEAIFRNFTYSVEGIEERESAAVAKIVVTQCDFSDVLDKYDRKSYNYITDNLYSEDVTDKDKLNAKCLDIYVSQIEKDAKAGKTEEHTIYIPLYSDGYNGWNVEIDEKNMKVIIGELAIPELK